METKIYYRIVLGLLFTLLSTYGVQAQDWQDIEPYAELDIPTSINYADQQTFDVEDYVTIITTDGVGDCNNIIFSQSVATDVSISNASSDLGSFSISDDVITFPSEPSASTITLTYSHLIIWTVNYDRALDFFGGCQHDHNVELGSFNATRNIVINYENNNSLVPGFDFTSPESVCDGSGFSIDIKTPRAGSTYRVRARSNTDNIIKSGSGDMTLSAAEAASLYRASDGGYSFIVTERRTGGYEVIDPNQNQVVETLEPSTGAISGETDVCPGDYEQVYSTANTGADSYRWSCNHCTMESSNGNQTMRVIWDDTYTSGYIEVFAREVSDVGNCDDSPVRLNVSFPDEVDYPDVTGPTQICAGSTATIGLDDSQVSYDYAIFESGAEVSGAGRIAGSNTAIAWDDLPPGDYEIRLLHPRCGWYVMGSRSVSYYSAYIVPTVINQNGQYCGEDTYAVQVNSPLEDGGYVWYEDLSGVLTEIHRGEDTQDLFLGDDREYFASYIDERGCQSDIQQIEYNIIELPRLEFDASPSVCVNDGSSDLNDFLVSDTPGGFWFGDYNSATGTLFIDNIDEADHDTDIEVSYLYVADNNCSVQETMALSINTLPSFEAEFETFSVCVNDGSVDLADNIANIDGAALSFNVAGADIPGSIILLGGVNYTAGEYNVVVTALNASGCADTREFTLRVDDVSVIEFTASDLTFCSYFEQINLNHMFSGFLGEFYVNSTIVDGGILTQDMTMWNEGNNSLRFIENGGCYQEHLFNLYVVPEVVFDLSNVPFRTCELDGDVEIADLIEPAGGILTGDFVRDGEFRALVAGPGTYEFNYQYETEGCVYDVDFSITNYESPNIYAGPDHTVCRNSDVSDFSNQVNQPGGIWSGHPAVSADGQFDASLVENDESIVLLTYTFTNANNCSASDQIAIFINEIPTVDIDRLSYTFCLNADPYDLSQDANGISIEYWAEEGITNDVLYPAIMGAGTHQIEAREESGDGCYNFRVIDVTISDVETLTVEDVEICANDAGFVDLRNSVSIPGGEFTGSSSIYSDHLLEVGVGNTGIHEIKYEVAGSNGCTIVGYFDVKINELPEEIDLSFDIQTCYNDEELELEILNPSLRYTYEWKDSNNRVVGTGDEIIVPNENETYVVTASTVDNCKIDSDPVVVTVNDIAGNITYQPQTAHIVPGTTVSFAVDFDAVDYNWQLSDRVMKRDESPVMVYNYSDTTMQIHVTLEDEHGCVKTLSRSIDIVDEAGSYTVEEEAETEAVQKLKLVTNNLTSITAYPNPLTSQQVNLDIGSINDEPVRIRIIDPVGSTYADEVHEVTTGENTITIEVAGEMQAGIYFIQITSNSIKEFIPLIKP